MKCKNCGFIDDDKNKFCVNCGSELISVLGDKESSKPGSIVCPGCGIKNEVVNKFCIKCGTKLGSAWKNNKSNLADGSKHKLYLGKNRHKINKHSINSKTRNLKPLWVIGGIIIGSILIVISFDLIFHKYSGSNEFQVETKSSNPVLEKQVTTIASKFICSCQTKDCANSSLETCTCGTAVEERQFIRADLEQNKKPDNIVVELANKYGFLKPEFKSKYNVDPGKIWNQN